MPRHARTARFFGSSRYRMWRRIRLCALLVLVVNVVRVWMANGESYLEALSELDGTPIGIAACALTVVLTALIVSVGPFLIWWCLGTFMMSRSRREATFSPTRDISYYREKLDGVTAAQVSMLADLRIEPREDAAATVLSLIMDGVLVVEGDALRVADGVDMTALPRSSRRLVSSVRSNNMDQSFQNWAADAELEAVDGVLLRWRNGADGTDGASGGATVLGGCLTGCGKGCLVVVLAAGLFWLVFERGTSRLYSLLDAVETDAEIAAALAVDPILVVELLLLVALAVLVLAGMVLPLVELIREVVENGDASRRIERTQLGEEATECVYGIRNYLRDFTALSDADRAALMLWDEFAVYAVALGENRGVVDQILGARGLTRHVLGLR